MNFFVQVGRTLLAIALIAGLAACNTPPTTATESHLLALSYRQFDQTPASGWRTLADDGRYAAAARLIEAYEQHSELAADQKANLHFHAAQLFAFAGDESSAIAHLEHTRQTAPSGSPIELVQMIAAWNDYVAATKAFLENNREELMAARDRMATRSSVNGEIPNLNIVDKLIAHFGEPYAVAYRAHE